MKTAFISVGFVIVALLAFWAGTTRMPEAPPPVDNTATFLVDEARNSNRVMENLTAAIDAKVDSVLSLVTPPPADTTVATAPAVTAAPAATTPATTPAVATAAKPKKQNG